MYTNILFREFLYLFKTIFFKDCTVLLPYDEHQAFRPKTVKLVRTSKFCSFYLELQNVYKNKFKNLIRTSKFQFSFWGLCFKPIKRTSSEGTGHNTLSGWNQLYFDISLYWVVFKETGAFFQLVFYEQLFCSIFAN